MKTNGLRNKKPATIRACMRMWERQIEQMALLVQVSRAVKFVAVVLVVAYFAIALVGKLTKPDGITYICDGELIRNTKANTYECKPRAKP